MSRMNGETGGAGWVINGTEHCWAMSPHIQVATDGLSGFVLIDMGAGLPHRGMRCNSASVLGQSTPDCVGRAALEVRNW